MSDILNKINQTKCLEVKEARATISFDELNQQAIDSLEINPTRNFLTAISCRTQVQKSAVIAEIKKASPSKGVLREVFLPAQIAREYELAGAACLSVLTDESYFQGHADFLKAARTACQLPVLRKDFIIDKYQIAQARVWGADAILLIAASLTLDEMLTFEHYATQLNMSVLVEVHNEIELKNAIQLKTPLLGINNRNLRTFEVTLETTLKLATQVPSHKIIITESGILKPQDVQLMQQNKIYGFLVGEAFMRAPHAGHALAELWPLSH